MTDRELLELAAKAAGMSDAQYQDMSGWGMVRHGYDEAMFSDALFNESGDGYWNPLTDDGDALRLAVRLGVSIIQSGATRVCESVDGTYLSDEVDCEGDGLAATRRAIVRAAAEIGKAMP